MSRKVWQIPAGPASRCYADLFLRHGVALIGPGDPGPWAPDREDLEFGGGVVRRFASDLKTDDVVLLRKGISTVFAVGLVASDYLYLNQFDDVFGWDLQHARRVRWSRLPAEHTFSGLVFGANPPRCSRTKEDEAVDFANRYVSSPPTWWQTAALPDLPPEEPAGDGFPEALGAVIAEANDLAPLYRGRTQFGERPSEDERIAHFVIPFLRALGWPPELIAVKWRNVDVAVFRSLPRVPENLQFIIEAKRRSGVEDALDQGKGYAESLGVRRDVVLTNGFRYRLYACDLDFQPVAYANLARLKRSAADLFARMRKP